MDEAIKRQLVEFITKRRSEGADDIGIQEELKTAGWETWMITNGFAAVGTTVKTGEARILTQAVEGEGVEQPLIVVDDAEVRALMAQAWGYFKGRWKTLVGILLLQQLVWMGLGFVLVIGGLMTVIAGAAAGGYATIPLIELAILLAILVGIVISTFGQLALYFGVSNKYANIGIFGAYKVAFSKIGAYMWLLMMSGLAIMGGMTLLIIPGIWASLWFFMVVFVMVDEDLGGMQALTKSKFYMKGNMGFVFGRMLIVSLVMGIAYIAIVASGSVWGVAVGDFAGETIAGLLGAVFMLFAGPYMLVFQYLLFQNLKGKKQGSLFNPQEGRSVILGLIIWAVVAFGLIIIFMATAMMSVTRLFQERGDMFLPTPYESQEPVMREDYWNDGGEPDLRVD